jgi:hypothetical protein
VQAAASLRRRITSLPFNLVENPTDIVGIQSYGSKDRMKKLRSHSLMTYLQSATNVSFAIR